MANVVFHAQFTAGKVGATGKVVTVDVDRIARADGARTPVVTGGAATEGIRGCYRYVLADVDLQTYDYLAIFVTADATVDQKEIPALSPPAEPVVVAPDNAGIAAVKAKTDLIPAGGPLAAAGYTAPDNAGIAAIKGKTDALPAQPAGVGAAMGLADGAITSAKFAVAPYAGPAVGLVERIDQTWRRFFKRHAKGAVDIKTYADNGTTVLTTQPITVSGSDETVGAAT